VSSIIRAWPVIAFVKSDILNVIVFLLYPVPIESGKNVYSNFTEIYETSRICNEILKLSLLWALQVKWDTLC